MAAAACYPFCDLRATGWRADMSKLRSDPSGEVGGGTFANGRRCEREAENCCVRQLILTGVVVTALGGYTATSGLVTSGLAQGMKDSRRDRHPKQHREAGPP